MTFRVRGLVTRTYRYANALGIQAPDPTVGMDALYPRGKGKHYPSIKEPAELAGLLRDIEGLSPSEYITHEVLWLAPRVFLRPSELQDAPWQEIDLDAAAGAFHPSA